MIKFGIFVILKVKSTSMNTDVVSHDSELSCFHVSLEVYRVQGKSLIISGLRYYVL